MEPIRVLHENVIMDPGGIETLLMNVYRHIDRSKVQFDFMVHRDGEAFYDNEIMKLGGRIYKTPKFSPFPIQYLKYKNAIKAIYKNHPEYLILHAHAELNLWPLKFAMKQNIPVRIAHSHNAKTTINLKYFFFLYERLFIKRYCTNMFMCSTPAGIWSFGENSVKNNEVIFIRNGIETERFAFNKDIRSKKRKELGLESKFVVGHVGRFMQQKNHTFLIDIFNEIVKKRDDAILLLVSEGRLMENIKEKVKNLGLNDKVIFLGNRNDVNELMQAMDIFLFPSLWEGLPLTGIEAQAAGLPVVFSDAITSEVCITKNAYKKSLKDSPQEWANFALEISNSFVRQDVTDEIIKAGFDIRTTAKWLEDFYLEQYRKYKKQ